MTDQDHGSDPRIAGTPDESHTTYEEMDLDDVARMAPFTVEVVDAVKAITSSLVFIIGEDHQSGFMVGAGEDGQTVHIAMAIQQPDETESSIIHTSLGLPAAAELARAINRAGRETLRNGMASVIEKLMARGGNGEAITTLLEALAGADGVVIVGMGDVDTAEGDDTAGPDPDVA